jgi:lipid A 3-O-deacylase
MGLWGTKVGLALACATAWHAQAEQGWEGQIVSLTLENDAFASSDRHYTQGSFVSYLSSDNRLPRWTEVTLDVFPTFGYEPAAKKWGFGLGQEIYTPEDLRTSVLQLDDRPYAGWLFGRFTLQRRGALSPRWSVLENFHLDLGMVGPESQAEQTQKEWHGDDPKGWRHQLKTEPAGALRYERRFQFNPNASAEGWGLRLIPHVGGSAGNLATFLNGGATVRVGYNIPNEFATGPSDPAWGFYFLTGGDGRFVVHNLFLDGNTWRESHRVNKRPFVADVYVGMAATLKNVEISFRQVFRSREFDDQKSIDSFGSVTFAIKF